MDTISTEPSLLRLTPSQLKAILASLSPEVQSVFADEMKLFPASSSADVTTETTGLKLNPPRLAVALSN